jgi:hypothetical protein
MNTGRLLPAAVNRLRGRFAGCYIGPHPLPVGDGGSNYVKQLLPAIILRAVAG